MKKINLLFLMLLAIIMPKYVYATDNDITLLVTEEELTTCVETGGYCKLGGNIKLTSTLDIEKEVILDLNGQSLTPADDLKSSTGLVLVERGAKLTIRDSKSGGKISTGTKDDSNVWAAIQMIYGDRNTDDFAELIVDSGTLEGYYYGIVGNGKNHNTKITINGGTISALNQDDSAGIYHPQKGTLTINDGTVKGGTGIEIRSGTLVVNKGTIEGIASNFLKEVNTNGTTTNGVGIAVAQHTTKNAINVTINGGNISGQYAFYEWNPHGNSAEDLKLISIKINNGSFIGTAEGVSTVYSEDFRDFIYGGTFNKSVSSYLNDDALVASKVIEDTPVSDEKSSHGLIIGSIIVIIAIGIGAGYVYIKKFS